MTFCFHVELIHAHGMIVNKKRFVHEASRKKTVPMEKRAELGDENQSDQSANAEENERVIIEGNSSHKHEDLHLTSQDGTNPSSPEFRSQLSEKGIESMRYFDKICHFHKAEYLPLLSLSIKLVCDKICSLVNLVLTKCSFGFSCGI